MTSIMTTMMIGLNIASMDGNNIFTAEEKMFRYDYYFYFYQVHVLSGVAAQKKKTREIWTAERDYW